MLENKEMISLNGLDVYFFDFLGKVDVVKYEVVDLKDMVVMQVKDVFGIVKDEVVIVVGEVKIQVKDFYVQMQWELKEQVNMQQQCVVGGLCFFSDEFGLMVVNFFGSGIVGDLVQQVFGCLFFVVSWFGDCDLGLVLIEVKCYVCCKLGIFILVVVVVGVVVGWFMWVFVLNVLDDKDVMLVLVLLFVQVQFDFVVLVFVGIIMDVGVGILLYDQIVLI